MTEKVTREFTVRAPETPRQVRNADECIGNTCPVAEGIIRAFNLSPEEVSKLRVSTAISHVPGYEPYIHPPRLLQWIRDHDEAAIRSLGKWSRTPPAPARFQMTLVKMGLEDTAITMAQKVSFDG